MVRRLHAALPRSWSNITHLAGLLWGDTRGRHRAPSKILRASVASAVALLGPPKRGSNYGISTTLTSSRPEPQTIQTLTLHFTTGVGCNSASVSVLALAPYSNRIEQ